MSAPLASMTGFARTDGQIDGVTWAWELRSVNGRGLDLKLRLPLRPRHAIEPALRDAAGKHLRRGNISANATIRREERPRLVADPAALQQILALAQDIAARLPGTPPPTAEGLLALPGVLRAANASDDESLTETIRIALTARLHRPPSPPSPPTARPRAPAWPPSLPRRSTRSPPSATPPPPKPPDQPAAQRARLQESLAALLLVTTTTVSPKSVLAQEVALLATKSDIREELDRLGAHIEAARALLAEGTAVGRRFDFLVQEFVREVNTLCSKSASSALTSTGLRLKATIEQLREQVQNVE